MPIDDQQAASSERRAFPRYAFGAVQEVAQLVNGEIPPRDLFEKVRCVDISRAGFAFYRTAPAHWEALVVALGVPPDLTYLTAKIANCEKVDRCGHVVYHIGCRFTGRVKLNAANTLEQMDDLEAAFVLLSGSGR